MRKEIDYKNTSTLEMNSFVGYPIVNYDTKYGEDNGYLCKTKTYFIKNKLPLEKTETYPEIYNELITYNLERNMLIKNICDMFSNKKILILTKIIEHGKTLKNLIEGSHLINSQVVKKQRKDSMKWFKEGKGGVLIAGIKIAGQGLNIEDLDVIIIACAHRSAVDSVQTIGRVKRIFPGKEFGYLIDFEDIGYFHKASNERKQVLKSQGNIVEIIDKLENIY